MVCVLLSLQRVLLGDLQSSAHQLGQSFITVNPNTLKWNSRLTLTVLKNVPSVLLVLPKKKVYTCLFFSLVMCSHVSEWLLQGRGESIQHRLGNLEAHPLPCSCHGGELDHLTGPGWAEIGKYVLVFFPTQVIQHRQHGTF